MMDSGDFCVGGQACRPTSPPSRKGCRRTCVKSLCIPFSPPTSRSGGRASEAKEAEGAPQVEAGKRLEELRRRRGETESEEFEKLKQKQQEAALELEELKKKREERRKVLEEEEQRRKQEEAERKVREEVRRAQPAQPWAPRLTQVPGSLSLVTLLAQGTVSSLVK